MNNNELNNNMQPNIGNQIMMGDTPNNINQPQTEVNQIQDNNNQNINQGINSTVNSFNQNFVNSTNEVQNDNNDTIFSNTETKVSEPVVEPSVNEKKDKKGKGPVIIIILLVIIILGLGGYITYDKFVSKDTPKTEDKQKTKDTTKTNKVKQKNNGEVVYSIIDEKHNGIVKKVPFVNIDSKYADEINDELDTMIKKGLEGQIADSDYPTDYTYYVNKDIVSIKFSWQTEGSMTYSKIYNINQTTGEKVSNTEILKQVNINEKDLNNLLVEAYKKARPLESIEGNGDAPVKECYQKDIDTLQNGKIKGMYLSENNELCVLFDLNYVAGAGIGEAILNVTGNKVILNPVLMQ